jgi:hypothetical protein
MKDPGPFRFEFHKSRVEWNVRAHGVCDRSVEDAYSSMAPAPTSSETRGPCKPDFYCRFICWPDLYTPILSADYVPLPELDALTLNVVCSVYLIWTYWIWTFDNSFCLILEIGLTAGVTDLQRMLVPPRYLILPLQLSGSVLPGTWLCILTFGLWLRLTHC